MRFYEFSKLTENATTTSGSIAPVVTALGAVQRRMPVSMLSAKYTNEPTPNTPKEYKKYRNK